MGAWSDQPGVGEPRHELVGGTDAAADDGGDPTCGHWFVGVDQRVQRDLEAHGGPDVALTWSGCRPRQRGVEAQPRRPQAHVSPSVEPSPPGCSQHVAPGIADAIRDHERRRTVGALGDDAAEVGRGGVGPGEQVQHVTATIHDEGVAVGARLDPELVEGLDDLVQQLSLFRRT